MHDTQEHHHTVKNPGADFCQSSPTWKKSASTSDDSGKSPSAPQALRNSSKEEASAREAAQENNDHHRIRQACSARLRNNQGSDLARAWAKDRKNLHVSSDHRLPPPPPKPPNVPCCGGGERVLGRSVLLSTSRGLPLPFMCVSPRRGPSFGFDPAEGPCPWSLCAASEVCHRPTFCVCDEVMGHDHLLVEHRRPSRCIG